jgi:hypothetical protein
MIGRGISQGETLSPFLSSLSLVPILNNIENDQQIEGIKLNDQINLKSLAYTDDVSYHSSKEAELSRDALYLFSSKVPCSKCKIRGHSNSCCPGESLIS